MSSSILLVGYRKGALKAADRLGIAVDMVCTGEEVPPKSSIPGRTWYHQQPEQVLRQILDSSDKRDEKYQSVIALTEKSVPLAGKIRDHLSIPGASFLEASTCHQKNLMKAVADKAGIPVARYRLIDKDLVAEDLVREWGWPLVVKELSLSGSRGMSICHDLKSLNSAWKNGKLVEAFVRGQEMSIESLCFEGEIIFSNITHYHRLMEMNVVPAQVSAEMSREILRLNQQILQAFGVRNGMVHVEIYWTNEGPLFGEMALRPPGGYILNLIKESYGLDPWEAILEIGMGKRPHIPKWQGKYSGAWIIHPGAGKVSAIEGHKELLDHPQLRKLKLKIEIGSEIDLRLGSGMEVGHAIFSDDSYEKVISHLETAIDTLKFSIKPTVEIR